MPTLEILDHIDPAALAYDEWLAVGFALKDAGASPLDWDAWSQRDAKRYKPGLCASKWAGFNGGGVTVGTLIELAKRQGWQPPHGVRESRELDWDDIIGGKQVDALRVIDPDWIEDRDVLEPDNWNPVKDLITYLNTLFEAQEFVGYVTESWTNEDGKHLPKKGSYTRTAGELIQALGRCKGDIGKVLGDYEPTAGAWIRFNPLDGQGVKDANVTAFRYALIESDELTIERQAAVYAELELPVAALVHSGKKSLHAIVRINATSKEEYRDRVNFLHSVCSKNNLKIDTANKNPSRLSRMPGVMRDGQKQFLVATNQGKGSWEEWKTFIEEANDSLPDFESLADVFNNLPDLAPPLIDGLLREGHKMLLSGPSKAGKSYLLLQLAIAIAEGRTWLGWPCAKGRVLYVNLELDRASCLHRLKTLYDAHGWPADNLTNIDLWNLRGKAVPLDALAPKLIRRALKRKYKAVIIDPIYKVLTGSENEADDMAKFCNQFDKICAELGAATIYCHHHSKGTQGQKSSRDRSSGSGVFARDPDAILDVIELIVSADRRKQMINRAVCNKVSEMLHTAAPGWTGEIGQDDALVADKLITFAQPILSDVDLPAIIEAETVRTTNQSGWRIEATLREFPPFENKHCWFVHPIHVVDADGTLVDAKADGEEAPWVAGHRDKSTAKKEVARSHKDRLLAGYATLADFDGEIKVGDLAETLGLPVSTIRKWFTETSDLVLEKSGRVIPGEKAGQDEIAEAVVACTDLSGKCLASDVAIKLSCHEKTVRRRVEKHPAFEYRLGEIFRKETP